MPLRVSYGLPAAEFLLYDFDTHEVPCRFHIDSCASTNAVNLLVHQWFVTKYPNIVDSYEYFDDENPFQPIVLAVALDTDDTEDFEYGKLTAVVTYKTCYAKVDGTPVKVKFSLGSSVAVNEIFGLPSFTGWIMILDFDESKEHCKVMQISFPLFLT